MAESALSFGASGRWFQRLWADPSGPVEHVVSAALLPAEVAFIAAESAYHAVYDTELLQSRWVGVPVVSVGNLVVGGTGKTPVTRWFVDLLLKRGTRPAVLHGGYGTDEPLLHRRWHPDVPVVVDRDRLEGARAARAQGANALVLDDGFQHRRMARDLDVVLVAAEQWTERRRLLPRGPWRERPSAIGRADLVLVTRKTASEERSRRVREALELIDASVAFGRIRLRPAGWTKLDGDPCDAPDRPVLAVAGLARPGEFFENARQAGADVASTLVFPDHHDYSDSDLVKIESLACERPVATTEKDAVKLSGPAKGWDIYVLRQEVVVESGEAAIDAAIDELLG